MAKLSHVQPVQEDVVQEDVVQEKSFSKRSIPMLFVTVVVVLIGTILGLYFGGVFGGGDENEMKISFDKPPTKEACQSISSGTLSREQAQLPKLTYDISMNVVLDPSTEIQNTVGDSLLSELESSMQNAYATKLAGCSKSNRRQLAIADAYIVETAIVTVPLQQTRSNICNDTDSESDTTCYTIVAKLDVFLKSGSEEVDVDVDNLVLNTIEEEADELELSEVFQNVETTEVAEIPAVETPLAVSSDITDNGTYCNWSGCSGVPQGCCDESSLQFCNANGNQCEGSCGGQWCSGSFGYCTWSQCDGVVRSTEWCNAAQSNCEGACGGSWCTNGGLGDGPTPSTPTQPSPVAPSPTTPAPFNSRSGFATTTRYWDCSGGACGCAYLPSGPGSETHCNSNAMFAAPSGNEYGASLYGTAAVSRVLFGNTDWLGEGCGKCYKLTGTSNIPGKPVVETTIVLKAANLCPEGNPKCAGNKVHFDIAAPGFDFTQASLMHVCPSRDPGNAQGFAACEGWMINSQNPDQNCDCSKFNDPVLEAGCTNFRNLNWDNPDVQYEAVACPVELDRLNCWEENGNNYPFGVPDFCASNDGPAAPVTPPVASPTKAPSKSPTKAPTKAPTNAPVPTPTKKPTIAPTKNPTPLPTNSPIQTPTKQPTPVSTTSPTKRPTPSPTKAPTKQPTPVPTRPPTKPPTKQPTPVPTRPPTKPPTKQPTPVPTRPPTKPPTKQPTPVPTRPPTKPPTKQPTPAPTKAPTSDGSFCCSNDYKNCYNDDWCNSAKDRCEGNCEGTWIKQGTCSGIPKWGECTNDVNGCCAPTTCQGDQWYKQCL